MFVIKRSENNPILAPHKNRLWEELSACNGCPIKDGKKTICFYRAISDPDKSSPNKDLSISTIGKAISTDGENFKNHEHFSGPEFDWEKYGCEDPRVTKFENEYYIFYTALSTYPFTASGIKIGLAISDDLIKIKEKHPVTPFNSKAMALFPERINGKIASILTVNTDKPPAEIAIRFFDNKEEIWDQDKWEEWYKNLNEWRIPLRRADSDQIEVGAPPIKTKDGWLIIYSYIQNYYSADKVFGIEAILLDLNDPRKVIARSNGPIMIPEEIYEYYGYVQNIIFPTGAVLNNDVLDIYYGASDTTTCKASVKLDDLLYSLKKETRMSHVKRFIDNPILSPIPEHAWEARSVFNPTAIDIDGIIRIIYRSMSFDGTSYFGYAESKDGENITYRHPEPIYIPREDFEMKKGDKNGNSGCEDPRITDLGKELCICYTAYDGINAPRVASSFISKNDFKNRKWTWSKPVLVTPKDIDDKDACVLPEKINGKYAFIHRVDHAMCISYIDDLKNIKDNNFESLKIAEPRKGMWDGLKIGLSSVPHKTSRGWLTLYHGIDSNSVYRVGLMLLDLNDPSIVVSRTSDAIFEPEEHYEKFGEVKNVVFPCGSVIRGEYIYVYYGGADSVTSVAKMKLSKLMDSLN